MTADHLLLQVKNLEDELADCRASLEFSRTQAQDLYDRRAAIDRMIQLHLWERWSTRAKYPDHTDQLEHVSQLQELISRIYAELHRSLKQG